MQIIDLPSQYRLECYKNIYNDRLYNSTTTVMMQVYKFLLEKTLAPETIDIIFSLCCTITSFSKCNRNCETHNAILNREFPEFPLFEIAYFRPFNAERQLKEGFSITLDQETVVDENANDYIKRTFIESGLTDTPHNKITIQKCRTIKNKQHLFVYCNSLVSNNARNKLRHNNQPHICQCTYSYDEFEKSIISIHDMKKNELKKSFTFNYDEYILDYYCVGELFFITLIDEHIHYYLDGREAHHNQFPHPQNHRLEIYDIESKELLHTQKLPLPEKYQFKHYNYLLDYADSTGYYLFIFLLKR